jgi:CBS domain-containing protein
MADRGPAAAKWWTIAGILFGKATPTGNTTANDVTPMRNMDIDISAAPDEEAEDHFLRLMFFTPHQKHAFGAASSPRAPVSELPAHFEPLPQSRLDAAAYCCLPERESDAPPHVQAKSPAVQVMTDLRRVPPVCTSPLATVDDANRTMKSRGVRSLFVVDGDRVVGIITAYDILSERPLLVGHDTGVRHDEVVVRDVMRPAEQLEVIDFSDVVVGRVGNVVATLKRSGRQHALVADRQDIGPHWYLLGLFSLTQIARQLGISPVVPDVAHCIADIEAMFARG